MDPQLSWNGPKEVRGILTQAIQANLGLVVNAIGAAGQVTGQENALMIATMVIDSEVGIGAKALDLISP